MTLTEPQVREWLANAAKTQCCDPRIDQNIDRLHQVSVNWLALREENERLRKALAAAIRIADEASDEWDKAPEGMRAGKVLLALAGHRKGYRVDIDEIHAALSPEPAP